MASTSAPKQVNSSASGSNNSPGKRKKSRGSKSSYLSKWLDKTMHHVNETTPNIDSFDFVNPNLNWQSGGSQFAPGFDPYRHMYGGPEPMSLPTLPSYYSPPVFPIYGPEHRYFQNVNRGIPIQRQRIQNRNERDLQNRNSTANDTNYLQPKNLSDSQDYTSLPPIITSVGDTNSNSDMNEKEKDDGSNARRYSDPCVRELPDVTQPGHGDMESESDDESSEPDSQVGSRLVSCLLDQISSLKQTNERLNKDLMNTRMELESIRHHAMLHKGSSSSIGATPSHSHDGGLINGQYSPGFLTDLVREIRDAARMREEAMYARVRAMVIERNDNLGSSEAKINEKTLEEIKSSLRASEADKRRMMDKINKLEDDLRSLKIANGLESNENKMNGNVEDSETELLRLRKENADMRKAKQQAEEHSHKLERLVTQLRSKFNGHQLTNGPDSLPSESEHEASVRVRRSSVNSSNNSTVLFGPVTDL